MPFYEYVCTQCGAQTEMLQKISDPPATECPVCHAQALSKMVSASGFRLKGGGWYETDFKSANKKNLAGADSASSTTSSGSSESTSAAPATSPAPVAPATKSSTDA